MHPYVFHYLNGFNKLHNIMFRKIYAILRKYQHLIYKGL